MPGLLLGGPGAQPGGRSVINAVAVLAERHAIGLPRLLVRDEAEAHVLEHVGRVALMRVAKAAAARIGESDGALLRDQRLPRARQRRSAVQTAPMLDAASIAMTPAGEFVM